MKQTAKIIIYTKDPCPFCVRAINLLNEKKLTYQEIDLTDKPEEIQKIKDETGWRTVPIILINDQVVGGYTDLKALDEDGKLDSLVFSLS
ncbi:MAG: glutathione S-transferase N-terminal domain-containing protein [Bdellovibrionaceae bacterium]|nr:glutathione S-transferase N-terminal domain-containing protein [Pseudobdellovibrionaceae bacterium]NUM58320.1 glutathione S-transferase N-terminal domain-containing protein [Pseudobdellovibrionaceae bacterium]